MEMRVGYRQSEIGVIPDSWEVKQLSEVADVKTGPFGSSLHERDYVQDGTPIITVEHLGDFGVEHRNLPMVSEIDRRRLAVYSLRQGDIVFSRVGSIDRNALIRDSESGWLFSGRLLRVRPDTTKVYSPYLSYHFHDEPFKRRVREVAVGQTMASLNTQILNHIPIALPPLTIQRAIASMLSDVDRSILWLDRLITKKRDLKQAAMQELLTGRRRLLGHVDQWPTYYIANMAKPRTDRVMPMNRDSEVFCVELEHVESASGRLIGRTDARESRSLKSVFQSGDVLFGKLRAYLRKFWLADRDGVCSTEFWVLRPNEQLVTSEYLSQIVRTDEFIKVASTAYGTHMPRSDWNVVKALSFRLPSLVEQAAIATVLSDMDAEIAALEARREKTRLIKQGMMQELLTGRTRLI